MTARAILGLSLTAIAAAVASAQEPPKFTSAVEVTSIDATVIDDHGRPIPNLAPADFRVRIDGQDRRVVTADWVPLVTGANAPATFVPAGYSSNENTIGGRLLVMAVDQPNIRFGGGRAVTAAASAFIDRLAPADRVAVVGLGYGAPATPFTADRPRIKGALSRMVGQKQAIAPAAYHITLAEAEAIQNGDVSTLLRVQDRECQAVVAGAMGGEQLACRSEVEAEAEQFGRALLFESRQTLNALRDLLIGLRGVAAPKTLILISEGFVLNDAAFTVEVGALAAAARTSVHALRLDEAMFENLMGAKPANFISDRESRGAGLETLAAAARGTVTNVSGSGTSFFERLENELSGYYLLGVESDARDRDGKPHPIRVEVSRRGTTVRTRRQFVSVEAAAAPRSPRDAVRAGLEMPLLMSALPLRVASFALQGPERDKIQLLIHADIGTDYTAARSVSAGYMLFDAAGRLADSQALDARAAPVMDGVPSPLQLRIGASVPPGEYTLKLAVAEGDRAGSVEHPIRAMLSEAGGVELSELMVGGPTAVGELMRPTIGYTVSFGSVHGYLEAYGPKTDEVTVQYEIAAADGGPALLNAEAPQRRVGDRRALFSRVLPVPQLPAGKYLMRAVVSEGGTPVKTLTRPFEVAPPAVLMMSAEGVGSARSVDAELFLPAGDELLARPFRKDEALSPRMVQLFRERVPPSARTAFDTGVASIAAGDYPKAEAALKDAIQPEIDSTASLSYLAVGFAASGHDAEAASVWQTALAEGGDIPQIYEWLGDALVRAHDLNAARMAYEEAAAKWPSDMRFTKPLAMLYATFGRGRQAVITLERYLAEHLDDDLDALFLGVEWIYHVRAAGGVVHTRAQDLRLARTYALAYEQSGGPQVALVRQWLEFLQK